MFTTRRPATTTAWKPAARRRLILTAAVWIVSLFLVLPLTSQEAPDGEVTAASGPSRLTSLDIPLARTSLGRIGLVGGGGAASESAGEPGQWLREGFEVTGADLYRFNCRSCHGARGGGLEPEILPIVNLVRETSSQYIKEQMAAQEQPVDSGLAQQMATNARRNLRARLLHGGAKMIPFDHLADDEFEALSGHLSELAEMPPAGAAKPVHQPVDRLGEHLIKGTCQICHDATPSPATSAGRPHDADIPSLQQMTADYSLADFLTGSHHAGSAEGGRGRGPKLGYLRDDELTAAYVYLAVHPPE